MATTTTRTGPGGTANTRTVDRPNGTQVVTRHVENANGDSRTVRQVRGTHHYRVCRSHWRHGARVRTCTVRYR